jgi:hypothetical protein
MDADFQNTRSLPAGHDNRASLQGLSVEEEFPLQARFRGQVIEEFRTDLLVGGAVLIELKAASSPGREPAVGNIPELSALPCVHLRLTVLRSYPDQNAMPCGECAH